MSECDCRPAMDGGGVYHELDCASRKRVKKTLDGSCPIHGPVDGFLSPPIYAGEPRDPRGTGERWCSKCGLGLIKIIPGISER